MAITNIQRINGEICEALGINPSEVMSVSFTLSSRAPIITIERMLNNGDSRLLQSVLKKYTLAEAEETPCQE